MNNIEHTLDISVRVKNENLDNIVVDIRDLIANFDIDEYKQIVRLRMLVEDMERVYYQRDAVKSFVQTHHVINKE